MQTLNNNNELYLKYFKWKTISNQNDLLLKRIERSKYSEDEVRALKESISYNAESSQLLCRKLKAFDFNQKQVVEHLDEWWYGKGFTSKNKLVSTCSVLDGKPYAAIVIILEIYCVFFLATLLCIFFKYRPNFGRKYVLRLKQFFCNLQITSKTAHGKL